MAEVQQAGGLAYRAAGEPGERVALLVHGYPESSHMWRHALDALAAAGWWALAPDLAGFGDSPVDPPGTWEHHVEKLQDFVAALGLPPLVLVTHDWGVMIGLRWACDHAGAARALVISDGGFFADRRWHDLANLMRTPEQGEALVMAYQRDGFAQALKALSPNIDEQAIEDYWKSFADETRRMGHLELYRSGDFEKLIPYEGRLAGLDLPTLLLWGEGDGFAPPALGERFQREIPGAKLEIFPGAGHFLWDDEPQAAPASLVAFLQQTFPAA